MICPKCGGENVEDAKFCAKCGASFGIEESKETLNEPQVQSSENVENEQPKPVVEEPAVNTGETAKEVQTVNTESPVIKEEASMSPVQSVNPEPQVVKEEPVVNGASTQVNNVQPEVKQNSKPASLNYFMYVIAVILKPYKSFREEEEKLCNTKTSLIFSSIIAGAMMLITLFKTMIMTVFTKSYSYFSLKSETNVDFSRLKNLDYSILLLRNLLMYAGVIAAIALVYYLVGMIFKKKIKFIKTLSIAATSLIPFVVAGMIVSPLLDLIWTPLSIIAMVGGAVYSILIFMNLLNEDLVFDSVDLKIYFHLICLSILGSAGYYIYVNLLVSSVASSVSDLFNLFG